MRQKAGARQLCGGPAVSPEVYFRYYGWGGVPRCIRYEGHNGECEPLKLGPITDAKLADWYW